MLKITRLLRDDGRIVLKLEGRLAGPWVALLKETCETHQRESGLHLIVDLAEVRFASLTCFLYNTLKPLI